MKYPAEIIARALCAFDGLPENMVVDGDSVWESFLPEAWAALSALEQAGFKVQLPNRAAVCVAVPL